MLEKLPSAKPRLAIVSTFDDLCGIAGYTRALMVQLAPYFEIEVFDLDQYLMRSPVLRVRRQADKVVKEFCERLVDFDFVNIQLEYGTLGGLPDDIVRRFKMISRAARRLSITFHTGLNKEPFPSIGKELSKFRIASAIVKIGTHFTMSSMHRNIANFLRKQQQLKPVHLIVHTRRDKKMMQYMYRLRNIHDHPLAFFDDRYCQTLRQSTTREQFPIVERLNPETKFIGVFGFVSPYKGFDTAIKAMHLLPDNYHLLVFGAVHPNSIKKWKPLDGYVETLLEETYANTSVLEWLTTNAKSGRVSMTIGEGPESLLSGHPRDISARVHFMGAQTDEGFARGMAICDCVVLPYLETGQSGSGVLSIAAEMGCRVIASRSRPFMQFARYNPGTVEFFDIGNFLELKDRLLARSEFERSIVPLKYGVSSNIEVYRAAHSVADAKVKVGA